ncbi:glutathione S-transferase-like protein [Pseudovibrio sp. FO-BEG1]|uniref:glutathione S-transferase family protein n=1 Tax=Pseudovibrio sp. (strain FO-BEG1) TaxID=911045 RepID=UPI000238C0AE|nr:glutathione S-transferase family protein [Pseudovibrio sp. FO-BEG1]AEV35957.1 glutathione S-transferase-like protein [Pseudovibrio sp. FO-BEG1]
MKAIDPKDLRGLHLFYNPYSNCAQRVMLLLAEKGIEAEMHFVDLMRSEQLTPEYHAINPDAAVPALVHDGVAMNESIDILGYLEELYPTPSFTPSDPTQKAQMEALLNSAEASHMSMVVNYVYSCGYGRLPTPRDAQFYKDHVPHRAEFHANRLAGRTANDPERAKQIVFEQFSELERLLETQEWLVGDQYSLADIAWFPNTIILRQLGYSFRSLPRVNDWIARLEAREAYKTSIQSRLLKLPNWVIKLSLKVLRQFGGRR